MANLKRYRIRIVCEEGINKYDYERVFDPETESEAIDKLERLVETFDDHANEENVTDNRATCQFYVYETCKYEKYSSNRVITAYVDMDLFMDAESKVDETFSKMSHVIKTA